MKVGLIFSGQGAQYPGMGSDLNGKYESAREIFDHAGNDIRTWCFNGTKEQLQQTQITQPTIYTVSMAAYNTFSHQLKKRNISIEIGALAGFSLGEYAALTVAGVIDDYKTGLEIIRLRGKYMADAGLDEKGNPKGAMAAVFGDRYKIEECVNALRQDEILECVNYNSPIQTAVAGSIRAIDNLIEKARPEFGLKAKKLSVSTAFHSSMMNPASHNLAKSLKNYKFSHPKTRMYSNTTGKEILHKKPESCDISSWFRECMASQINSPVRWQEIVEEMYEDGINVFIEIGPGKTLTSQVSKTLKGKDITTLNIEDSESLNATLGFFEQ